jgi:hypothetical protein
MAECKRPAYDYLRNLNERYMALPSMTLEHIGVTLGVAHTTVRKWFIRHSLPIKPQGKHMKGRRSNYLGRYTNPNRGKGKVHLRDQPKALENAA